MCWHSVRHLGTMPQDTELIVPYVAEDKRTFWRVISELFMVISLYDYHLHNRKSLFIYLNTLLPCINNSSFFLPQNVRILDMTDWFYANNCYEFVVACDWMCFDKSTWSISRELKTLALGYMHDLILEAACNVTSERVLLLSLSGDWIWSWK